MFVKHIVSAACDPPSVCCSYGNNGIGCTKDKFAPAARTATWRRFTRQATDLSQDRPYKM